MSNQIADFRLELGAKDLTTDLRPRLIDLSLTEARGEEADQLDVTLDDADGRLALPKRGGIITLSLGWRGRPLVLKGRFKIDEVEHKGAPDQVTIRARSADLTASFRDRRDRSWSNATLGDVLGDLAAANGLELRIAPELASREVSHLAQSRESDANLLTRLGRQYDAAATVKAGRLIFSPIGRGSTPTGVTLQTLTLTRADGDSHTFKQVDREAFSGVEAAYHDVSAGRRGTVRVDAAGEDESDDVAGEAEAAGDLPDDGAVDGDDQDAAAPSNRKRLRRVFSSASEARQHAQAEAKRIGRGAAEMSFTLAYGRPELYPEQRVKVLGIKPEIDAAAWLVKSVSHRLDGQSGFITSLELETG